MISRGTMVRISTLVGAASLLAASGAWSAGAPAAPAAQSPAAQSPAQQPGDFAILFTLGYGGDLLPQEPAAKALAESLRGDDSVWGYHLYSDGGARVPGRDRDVKNVHRWDPTHPTFVGFRRTVGSSLNDLTEPDVVGFYDYHWVRDRSVHFADMLRFGAFARDHEAALYRWVWVQNGRAGIGHVSSPTTLTANNDPKDPGAPPIPPPLAGVPDDHWFQITAGEAVVGMFRDEAGRDYLMVANHNAYVAQAMTLTFAAGVAGVERLDAGAGSWRSLTLDTGAASWELGPGYGDLLRIVREAAPTGTPEAPVATPGGPDAGMTLWLPVARLRG